MFREFVKDKDLVFDVGANRGDAARQLLSLGAEVICIEPQKHLADQLTLLNVTVHQAAVGAHAGFMDLYSSSDDRFASLRADWLDGHRALWDWPSRTTTTVPVVTLDLLISQHRLPEFIKIDTEGHEDDVIRGLSTPVPALSFEYCGRHHPLYDAHGGARALPLVHDLNPRYRYRFAEHSTAWASDWLTIDQATQQLQQSDWGDIYAREADDLR